MSQSLLHAPSDRDGYDDERANETERKRRRLLGQDNFQSETGAVDVDKYMMAYIEEELAKRRAASGVAGGTPLPPSHRTEAEMRQAILDPNDELSKIAEQYHQLQHRPDRDTKQKDEEEGSVTLSASMLGGVPEWDLGIEAKIRNIEQTEMAKRRLRENKKQPVAEEPATNMRCKLNNFFRKLMSAQTRYCTISSFVFLLLTSTIFPVFPIQLLPARVPFPRTSFALKLLKNHRRSKTTFVSTHHLQSNRKNGKNGKQPPTSLWQTASKNAKEKSSSRKGNIVAAELVFHHCRSRAISCTCM